MLTGSCHCKTVTWTYDAPLESVTACNCTACSRYGVLWAYDHEGEGIKVSGPTTAYQRRDHGSLGFHFCANCGNVAYWRATKLNDKGQRRIAVNIRLADHPDQVQSLMIDHFDGLNTFDDLPRDGRCVRDMWF